MSSASSGTAVLLLGFNRPEATARVLEALSASRPERLYVAVDGPRARKPEDADRVRAVRLLAANPPWACTTHTRFLDENLGCKLAVSQAISWFFEHEEQGIILEDDCVPHPSFFPYATQLLARYRDDERVAMISGDNFQQGRSRAADSYYFSRYAHIWGWASWRRAWRHYDHTMSRWPSLRAGGWLHDILGDAQAVAYWTRVFDETHGEHNTSWAYRWMFALWSQSALAILPNVNLVTNIGFGEQATHTMARDAPIAALAQQEMRFPLRHPACVIRDAQADDLSQRTLFSTAPPAWRRLARRGAQWFAGLLARPSQPQAPAADMDPAAAETIRQVQPYTMTSPERLFALIQAMRYVHAAAIPGDVVECGVWRGGSMMAAARTLLECGDDARDLRLFDTFEGMSVPSARDIAPDGSTAEALLRASDRDDPASAWCYASDRDVRSAMALTGYPAARVHLVKGKVEDTIPGAAPGRIALLRLDTDWYESTRHELEHLYPRLSPGGVLIIDDYGHWAGCRQAVDEYFAAHGVTLLLNRIDYTGRIAIKPA